MFRIRRRLTFVICVIFVIIFLMIYLLINYAAPGEDKKPNFMNLESKVRELEQDFRKHGGEMRILIKRLEEANKYIRKTEQHQQEQQKQQQKKIHQSQQQINSDERRSKDNTGQQLNDNDQNQSDYKQQDKSKRCIYSFQHIPQPDIQMLEMYRNMSFIDKDGGVWKQGWNIKYDPLQYNSHHKLKVFVVPHSHNDPGWTKTFLDYYNHQTKHILSNALRHLKDNPDMKFIWAEISYLAHFYDDLGERSKQEFKKLVGSGQFEIVTGGWVMPDEANSHWHSILMQLTEGQIWLKNNLNVTPRSSWSIDPFGHSPTMPYILKKADFENLLIQRTHYSVKKELASRKQLEFYWRQLWDDVGETDLFTHMMPFYSYDIPHSCGPDPKICCQFDFKRLPGFGLSCPWRVPPQVIDDTNVAIRAEMLIDQWKKKSELYSTNIVLFPLGDDFRYSQSTEWEVQRTNYENLFNYINNEQKYFVDVRFGTLQEYFDAVHEEQQQQQQMRQKKFPILSGDFFTYADRSDNYWSGYYTSRPYHKRMDRVLLHYIEAAEMLHAWHSWDSSAGFNQMLTQARQQLSLFQHHDGITGTAKTFVVEDYARRMLEAIESSKFIMQQAVYRLLTKPEIYNGDFKFNYFYLDDSRWPGGNDGRTTIILGEELPRKHLVFHNALPQWREEIVDFYVATIYVSVFDYNNVTVPYQISPVWNWYQHTTSRTVAPQASNTKYRLIFKVKVPPLGLSTYVVKFETKQTYNYKSLAKNQIMSTTVITQQLLDYPIEVQFLQHDEIHLKSGTTGPNVLFTKEGMMKSIQLDSNATHTPVRIQFFKYGTRSKGEHSGAYLFLPNGPAVLIQQAELPIVLVTQGQIESSVSVGLQFGIHETILRDGEYPEIRNYIDLKDMDDTEVVMRLQSRLRNNDIFYTDLNGLQMIKRQRFTKLPLQANYYPIPTAIYLEDDQLRLTVVSGQPLGGSSLAAGEIEIMQDRRLTHDDERGLGQGVLDNQPVLHIFRILLERIDVCQQMPNNHPSGALTLNAYRTSKSILKPLHKFIYTQNEWFDGLTAFGFNHQPLSADMEIVTMRNLKNTIRKPAFAPSKDRIQHSANNLDEHIGVIVHRSALIQCPQSFNDHISNNEFDLHQVLQWHPKNASILYQTSLTFLKRWQLYTKSQIALCPMDTEAFVIQKRS